MKKFAVPCVSALNTSGDLFGKINSKALNCDGLRLTCEPSQDLGKEIAQILEQEGDNFPYEYYSIKFTTFSDQAYSGYSRFFKHLVIDSSQINNEYATREYTKSVYSANAEAVEKIKYQNEYRKHKGNFRELVLIHGKGTRMWRTVGMELRIPYFFICHAIREGGAWLHETSLLWRESDLVDFCKEVNLDSDRKIVQLSMLMPANEAGCWNMEELKEVWSVGDDESLQYPIFIAHDGRQLGRVLQKRLAAKAKVIYRWPCAQKQENPM